jgi:DNA (cytosine-5)-methyltransferase 1
MDVNDNLVGTLRAEQHGHQPIVCIAGNIIGRDDANGGHQLGVTEDDVSFTLTATDRHAICMTSTTEHAEIGDNFSPTLTARNSKEPTIVSRSQTVRRLTPTECERLQGFQDGHTNITFKGKPTSDGPRYKALGNSMAVPVIKWLGEGILIAETDKDS